MLKLRPTWAEHLEIQAVDSLTVDLPAQGLSTAEGNDFWVVD